MVIVTTWYPMDGKPGVDLNNVLPAVQAGATTNPEYPNPPHKLGDRVQGNDGSEWMFVIASATVTAFNMVYISNSFSVQNVTASVGALTRFTYGYAQFQPLLGTAGATTGVNSLANAGDFFWCLIKANGGMRVNVTASVSTTAGSALYISPTVPGFLTTSACASNRVNGLVAFVGATAANDVAGSITIQEAGMFTYLMPADAISVMSF